MLPSSLHDAIDAAREPVRFWWRDDDAGRSSERLGSALAMAQSLEIPIVLAVVPAWLEPGVTRAIRACSSATVVQHGWDHGDHSAPGMKKIELGGLLEREIVCERLRDGFEILARAFPDSFAPVLVPPWNRIDTALLGRLAAIGYRGISTYAADERGTACGLAHVNPQLDPIAWRSDRSFASLANLARSVGRAITVDPSRPIGLLTHHLDMNEAAFAITEELLSALRRHPRIQWPTPAQLLARPI